MAHNPAYRTNESYGVPYEEFIATVDTIVLVLVGTGIPLFGHLDESIALELLETGSARNGFVQSRYRVRESSAVRPGA